MKELVRLFAQIALLRRGPQDLPASSTVLAATVAGYFAVNVAVSSVLPPISGPWLLNLFVDILFTLIWYALLLRLVGRSERFLQTATAVFGFQAVLSPMWIASVWLLRQFAEDQNWQFPISLVGLGLVVWMVAANGRVLKSAVEWPMAACVILVVLQILTGQLLLIYLMPAMG